MSLCCFLFFAGCKTGSQSSGIYEIKKRWQSPSTDIEEKYELVKTAFSSESNLDDVISLCGNNYMTLYSSSICIGVKTVRDRGNRYTFNDGEIVFWFERHGDRPHTNKSIYRLDHVVLKRKLEKERIVHGILEENSEGEWTETKTDVDYKQWKYKGNDQSN